MYEENLHFILHFALWYLSVCVCKHLCPHIAVNRFRVQYQVIGQKYLINPAPTAFIITYIFRFRKIHAINMHTYIIYIASTWIAAQYIVTLLRQCGNEITLKFQVIAKLFEHDYKTFYVLYKSSLVRMSKQARVHKIPEIDESDFCIDNTRSNDSWCVLCKSLVWLCTWKSQTRK